MYKRQMLFCPVHFNPSAFLLTLQGGYKALLHCTNMHFSIVPCIHDVM